MARIIQTTIFADEEAEFGKFLLAAGFADFHLSAATDSIYLNIYFDTPATIMNYVLRGVEQKYKAMHSNKYYYDLDQDWSEEAENFFNDDES